MKGKNFKKGLNLVILLLLLANFVFAAKLAVLPEVLKPFNMWVSEKHLYISEEETIFLYSLENFKLIRKFGGKGEGPGEFRKPPWLRIYPDYLLFEDSSSNRLSFFTRDGIFKNDTKIPGDIIDVRIVGNNFVGTTGDIDPEKMITKEIIKTYTKDFKPVKELCSWQGRGAIIISKGSTKKFDFEVIRDYIVYEVYGDRIYLGDTRKGFFISVYDSSGNKLYDINREYKKKRITEDYKTKHKNDAEKDRRLKNINFVFPEYFPAYERFELRNGKIYTWTYEKKEGKKELIILDLKGNILEKTFLTWQRFYSIDNGKYYYLLENDAEECELHVETIK